MNIVNFLAACGGKPSGKSSEWIFDCFMCDGKEKLYFNTSKLIGFCQKCQKPVSLKTLALELGGVSVKDIQKFIDDAAYNDRLQGDFRENILDALLEDGHSRAVKPHAISFPPTFRTLQDGESSVIGRKAIAYLLERGFDRAILDEYGFGYCSGGYYANRIIIPFWERGKLVYWQARDFTKKVPLSEKILNPTSASISIGKSSVVFNIDNATGPLTVICESWGSAIATGRIAVALNGKSMSSVQQDKLLATPTERFLVVLDHGAEDEAWSVAERLSAHRDTAIAFLPYGDPNEVPRNVLLRSISKAITYTATAHMRYKAEHLLVD